MSAPEPTPEPRILIWALTAESGLVAMYCPDVDTAVELGRQSVRAGTWKTWDAFELATDGSDGRKLVATHSTHGVKRPRLLQEE
jgi:hypothetical protein